MASVSKHFIARHGVAVGSGPIVVISDTGAATITNLSISGSLQTAFNLNSQILTNANIDSGTIDGATIATSNITVGATKTLDVSAGTLTLANDQISGDKIHAGTISGSVTITTPYIATIHAQAATGGILTLRSNSTDVTSGYVSIPMTTASTTVGTGALVVAGGLGVSGQSTLSNVVITGNLTVNGTTQTTNSTVVTIDDPVFTLGGDTAPSSDDNKDRGIEFRWHTGAAARVGFFGYDDSTGKFTFIPDATNTGEVFSGTKGFLDAYLSASDLSGGTIPSAILGTSTLYLGSTGILLNQGSGTVTTLAGMTSITSTSFTGALTGNASTATTLQTARAINGVNFDGSAAITVPANVTDDNTTVATYYPMFAVGSSGNQQVKVSSTKLIYYPVSGVLQAVGFSGSGVSLTNLPAGQLTGTIPSAVLGSSTLYVGTTAIALNRASAAQALTGITSIDGSAAKLTTARLIGRTSFDGTINIDPMMIASYGNMAPPTLRTVNGPGTGLFTYGYNSTDGGPSLYGEIVSFGGGPTNGQSELAVTWLGANTDAYIRSLRDTTDNWTSWNRLLSASNFNEYAPTLTGVGATGTSWAITTTGNVPLSGALYVQSQGLITSWGATNGATTGAFNAVMGTGASATWLISGSSGGVFRGGIQLADAGGVARYYTGAKFFTFTESTDTLSATNINGVVTANAGSNWAGNAVPVANGGTGATTAANARTNLSVYSKLEADAAAIMYAIALG